MLLALFLCFDKNNTPWKALSHVILKALFNLIIEDHSFLSSALAPFVVVTLAIYCRHLNLSLSALFWMLKASSKTSYIMQTCTQGLEALLILFVTFRSKRALVGWETNISAQFGRRGRFHWVMNESSTLHKVFAWCYTKPLCDIMMCLHH